MINSNKLKHSLLNMIHTAKAILYLICIVLTVPIMLLTPHAYIMSVRNGFFNLVEEAYIDKVISEEERNEILSKFL